jgi:predicted RNA-binding Zn-ribbon protein involved in translation (DUF1610 family)
MVHREEGATPLERLQSRYNHEDMRCPECGYEDDDGEWKAMTDGSTILYRHVCPSCGEIRKRTYRVSK